MSESHVAGCRDLVPDADIELLGRWSKTLPGAAIPDPVGQPLAAFRETYRLIEEACAAWIDEQLAAS